MKTRGWLLAIALIIFAARMTWREYEQRCAITKAAPELSVASVNIHDIDKNKIRMTTCFR